MASPPGLAAGPATHRGCLEAGPCPCPWTPASPAGPQAVAACSPCGALRSRGHPPGWVLPSEGWVPRAGRAAVRRAGVADGPASPLFRPPCSLHDPDARRRRTASGRRPGPCPSLLLPLPSAAPLMLWAAGSPEPHPGASSFLQAPRCWSAPTCCTETLLCGDPMPPPSAPSAGWSWRGSSREAQQLHLQPAARTAAASPRMLRLRPRRRLPAAPTARFHQRTWPASPVASRQCTASKAASARHSWLAWGPTRRMCRLVLGSATAWAQASSPGAEDFGAGRQGVGLGTQLLAARICSGRLHSGRSFFDCMHQQASIAH